MKAWTKNLIIGITASIGMLCAMGTFAQDYSHYVGIIREAGEIAREDKEQAVQYLRVHQSEFEEADLVPRFLYDCANGAWLHSLERDAEALPFLERATAVMDDDAENCFQPQMENFLICYFWRAEADFAVHRDKDRALELLNHAKEVYEKSGLTESPLYKATCDEIASVSIIDALPGVANSMTGNYEQSTDDLERLLANYLQCDHEDPTGIGTQYAMLANAYFQSGRYNDAERTYLSGIAFCESNGLSNSCVYASLLDGISSLYTQLHNYDKANAYNEKARYIFEECKDFGVGYVRCLSNGAVIQLHLGNSSVAKIMMDIAVNQARENFANPDHLPDMTLMETLSGKTLVDDEAEKRYNVITRIQPFITLLSSAAVIYQELGYIDEAVDRLKEGLTVCEGNGIDSPLLYNNIGYIHLSKGDPVKAVPYFEQGYKVAKLPNERIEIGTNLALAQYLGHIEGADTTAISVSATIRQSIADMFAFLSANERSQYWAHYEQYVAVLNHIIYQCGSPDNYGAIYNNLLATKGILLRSTNRMREAILSSGNADNINAYNRLLQLRRGLSNITDENKRKTVMADIEALDKQLTREVSEYADMIAQADWLKVQSTLKSGDMAIEFFNIGKVLQGEDAVDLDGQPMYAAVLIKQKGLPKVVELCTESQLDSIPYTSLYTSNDLYDSVWGPLKSELKGMKRIYFAPDRDLYQIGIEYALRPDGKRMDDVFDIIRLSSTQSLVENHGQVERWEHASLFGGLHYDLDASDLIAESRAVPSNTHASRAISLRDTRDGVEDLVYTGSEVSKISELLTNKGIGAMTLTQGKGTESAFRGLSGKPMDVLHLATHGFFWSEAEAQQRDYIHFLSTPLQRPNQGNDLSMLRSGLLFSGANIALAGEELPDDVEDGILTAQEIADLDLGKVDLVVLSACETGRGDVKGDGVFGLQRGFKLAGARSLLMSLWKVDDEPTMVLMTEFYRNLLDGKSKVESLRLAQQHVRQQPGWESPEKWAGFILLDAID